MSSALANKKDRFELRPIHPKFGMEVIGLDLAERLDESTVSEIRNLFHEHLVLLFRDQTLSEENHVNFTSYFGKPGIPAEGRYRSRKNPEIMRIGNVDQDGNKLEVNHATARYFTLSEAWHSDGSFRDIPSYASVLHSLEVPDEGGDTCFISMVAVYNELPDDLKAKVAGRHMVHDYSFTRIWDPDLPPIQPEDRRRLPPMTHPLVRTLPDSRKTLFFTGNVSFYIGGMTLDEGKRLHEELMSFSTQEQFVYTHKWRVGDVLMWDNRGTMHQVRPYDQRKRRLLQRTEVAGTEIPA